MTDAPKLFDDSRDLLDADERTWLDAYHAECRDKIGPRLSARARLWMDHATRPL